MARHNPYWKNINRKFDSKFEEELHLGCLSHCEFHPKEKIAYTVPRHYHPDFVWENDKGLTHIIEAKGRFEDTATATKYRHIRDNLPDLSELVFLFQTPKLPMPRAKLRKDGTKQTHQEWADRHNFRWFTIDTIHKLFEEDTST